jgi:hypothetical protein
MSSPPSVLGVRRRFRPRLFAAALACGLIAYVGLAYGLAPLLWTHFEHQRAIAGLPFTTFNKQGIAGDALNVGLEGSREDVLCAMAAAGWTAADPVNFRTSVKIVGSVLLDRPYLRAPVSPLLYQGRREDLAFEKAAGRSADRRHHVRLWKALEAGDDGRPVWLGAATFDRGVGVSRYTGQVTHHIAPDIDAERDLLSSDLADAGKVEQTYETSGVGPTLNGRNAGGDRYFTDGEIRFSRLTPGCQTQAAPPARLPNPPAVQAKNRLWRWLKARLAAIRAS